MKFRLKMLRDVCQKAGIISLLTRRCPTRGLFLQPRVELNVDWDETGDKKRTMQRG